MRTDSELQAAIAEHFWWHDIELRPGIVTPGAANVQAVLPEFSIPPDLTGMSVLDVGCWDGFFSFECERRGAARVVAADLWEPAGRGAFDLAREELGSKVEPVYADAHNLTAVIKEKFDLVLFLGVLYHLKYPLLGLEQVAAVTKEGGEVIVDTVILRGGNYPVAAFFPQGELSNDPTNWWAPNEVGMIAMMQAAGFTKVVNTVPLYKGGRSVFHGTKISDELMAERADTEYRRRHQHQFEDPCPHRGPDYKHSLPREGA